ncbi:asparaginase [Sphingopyxis sp. L1A2A]|uniref:asparaginase n=1 Tax=Sphingopyxis sp. L1A2A TaxID=2502247 RepID=UPI0024B4C36A|nr:asparaginase [Sphingopyxis sp. L1A2A]
MASTRPRTIGIFSMGGTIAMTANAGGRGVAPQVGFDLLSPMRRLHPDLTLAHFELFAKPSPSVSLADVQLLCDQIEEKFRLGLCGAVVTHGTDTLEETAFALSLLMATAKPVVVTGAMRHPEAPGADGPANLASAILVAASGQADGLGPLVLFGDEIHAPHLVRKIHSSRPHAFTSDPFGPMGHIVEGRLDLQMQPTLKHRPLRVESPVLAVPVLQAGLDLEPETVAAFSDANIGALIIAGVGGGHVSSRAVDAIAALAMRMPVIITSRVGMGHTLSRSYAYGGSEMDLAQRGVINGGRWRPAQARIIVQMLLSVGKSRDEIAVWLAR